MILYSMTATFGKLEHETLTLTPGLNIIEAPNEWGKSTWCAFLVTMLYGLDTRAKSTKTLLADKELYAPWSGSPMSGRLELHWNGRDITIERSTKGRTPLGEFKAYETATGLPIPALSASNCGQMLLGVEKSVFLRSGFLRLNDLPITQDEALRRRLNALVTTGDESGTADALAQKLKDLKNRCRHNRTGLLPQAEAQEAELAAKHRQFLTCQQEIDLLTKRHAALGLQLEQLENHRTALQYQAAQEDARRVSEALQARDEAQKQADDANRICSTLPTREEAVQKEASIRQFYQQLLELQAQSATILQPPLPDPSPVFQKMTPDEALAQVEADAAQYRALQANKASPAWLLWLLGILLAAAGIASLFWNIPVGIGLMCIGAAAFLFAAAQQRKNRQKHQQAETQKQLLQQKYASADPEDWRRAAYGFIRTQQDYQQACLQHQVASDALQQRIATVKQALDAMTGGRTPQEQLDIQKETIAAWDQQAAAMQRLQHAQAHLETAQAMAKTASPPQQPDTLTYTLAETRRLLEETSFAHRQTDIQLGQIRGHLGALGDEKQVEQELTAIRQRIARLEQTYAALDYAQNTLVEATAELQRRFAPKISARAQDLFSRLTDGRYQKLVLGSDLSLSTNTETEDVLRSALWRSEGTVDQLYLALRLAVAEELTPDAPLILDDALVRFDDRRLASALKVLQESASTKQVILFTCQTREKAILADEAL